MLTPHRRLSLPVYLVALLALVPMLAALAAVPTRSDAAAGGGMLVAWGDNIHGDVGDGTTIGRRTPAVVTGLSGVTAVAAGDGYGPALLGDGTVWAWGWNHNGELGDGTNIGWIVPVMVHGLSEVKAISAGSGHSLALKHDGTVWAWGYNCCGQLGDGTTVTRREPVKVSGLSDVISISSGGAHGLAVESDGSVWAWGENGRGQLGDGTTSRRLSPVRVAGLSGAVAVAAGDEQSLALKSNGTVWGWGRNDVGQLGDGTTTDKRTPTRVPGLSGMLAVSTGARHSLALRGDGTVWAWGDNQYGQVSAAATDLCGLGQACSVTPVRVGTLTGITAIAAGAVHSLAVKNDGTVAAWGRNNTGQLGNGSTANRTTPARVAGLSGATAASGNFGQSLAVVQGLTYAQDGFARNASGGWGLADLGGGYTVNQPFGSELAVGGGVGSMGLLAGGTAPTANLMRVSARDVDLTFRARLDKLPQGGTAWVGARARVDPSSHTYYLGRLRLDAGGRAFLVALRYSYGDGATLPASEVQAPMPPVAAGSYIRVRMQVTGANPTAVRLKAWPEGQAEPMDWQYEATDAGDIRTAGGVGLMSYLGPSITNGAITASFDDLLVRAVP